MMGALLTSYKIYLVTNVVFLTKNTVEVECCFPVPLSEHTEGEALRSHIFLLTNGRCGALGQVRAY